MGWVYRASEKHQCALPELDSSSRAGDLWECDEYTCRERWIVHDSQRDGLYFTKSRASQLRQPTTRVTFGNTNAAFES